MHVSPSLRRVRRSDGPSGVAIDGRGLYLIPGLIDSHVHLEFIPGMSAEQEQAHPDMQALVASAHHLHMPILLHATGPEGQALGLDVGVDLGEEIGTVQVGKRANVLLVRMDPREDVGAYDQIVKVILVGGVLDPGELAADRRHWGMIR